ncbi:hypothetical protein E3N88_08375 [Mikania micrantha]|uniref:Cytochrome b5 heme-binding domain-containing protein n=1 Tax=Mikania micrantha TaxID=192012 RepID=A0A5N6PG17_9ASTR|nr:hypothetical protein E3N88_08375 [Mikania micrantha]
MELTLDQLNQYDGTNPSNPIYIAVKGRIFDVSTAKSFYGPGGSYAMFAGKDATRALAKMSKNDEDVVGSLDGLTEKEIGVLDDWEKKFEAKYRITLSNVHATLPPPVHVSRGIAAHPTDTVEKRCAIKCRERGWELGRMGW